LNYCKVSLRKKVEFGVAFIAILLTIMSAVSADTFEENNYYNTYSSYEGPKEGFFEGVFGGISDLIVEIPKFFLKGVLNVLYFTGNFAVKGIVMLLTEKVPIDAFFNMWKVIIYILSSIFALILAICGINLTISGQSPEKRAQAKSWLQKAAIMIVVVPASFMLYRFLIDFSSGLTTLIMNYVSTDFLYIGQGSLANLSLELGLGLPYTLISILTVILLVIRFGIVAGGTLLFPIGLTLYFTPPTQEYGKLVLNFLLVNIFANFFIALFLATFSLITQSGVFVDIQIIVACAAMFVVDIFLFYIMFFAAIMAVFRGARTVIGGIATAKFFG
jgi:hypothetical protein